MSAAIEKSLCIGILKTRFDMFDDVTLKLKDGQIVSGVIIDLGDNYVRLEKATGDVVIYVNDIEDYIN